MRRPWRATARGRLGGFGEGVGTPRQGLEKVLAEVAPDGGGSGDRYLAPEIARVAELILAGRFTPLVGALLPTLAP